MPSLPDLPTEILMEIVSYYPPLVHGVPTHGQFIGNNPLHNDITHSKFIYGGTNQRKGSFVGNNALRALSQTSRILRGIFLSLLWARVHACFTPWNEPKRKIKTRAKMLERRMIGIQRSPYIVPYIRSLSVTLVECGMENWRPMAEFIRVLDSLPNLKDLTILRVPLEMVAVLSISCRGKVFPSVLRLAFEDDLESIMPCFPNVQTVTFMSPPALAVLVAMKAHCQHIHTINNLPLSPLVVNCLRDTIANVGRISVWDNHLDQLPLLEGMEALSDLRIHYRPRVSSAINSSQPYTPSQKVVAAATRVLRTSKAVGRKTLRIYEEIDGFPKETLIVVGGNL
ncbi:hypothetical protein B0H12DRAFT_470695 [Mycena haematopus]|nr:hypothetical protein B0H12DRAFT_470695 [Mycena haematopus]